jgi:mannose-1-phosphate guanylyltransferase
LGVVDDKEFSKRLAEKTIRVLIPKLFRELFSGNDALLKAAERCEKEGTQEAAARAAAEAAAWAARAAAEAAARAAAEAAAWAARAAAEAAAWAAARAAARAANPDAMLLLSAKLALDVLKELNSPGCALLETR